MPGRWRRVILPVQAHDLEKGMDGSQLVIVNKGDALWRIIAAMEKVCAMLILFEKTPAILMIQI